MFLQNSFQKCRSSHLAILQKQLPREISQNSQENTHARVSLLIKLQAPTLACNFIKKETLAQVFSQFCEISENTFSYRTPLILQNSFWFFKIGFLKNFLIFAKNICVEVSF